MSESLASIYARRTTPEGYGDKGTAHSYIRSYEDLFAPLRGSARYVLEIGVGPSALSLLMWSEFFSEARITGVDNLPVEASVFPDRIRVLLADAYDKWTVAKLAASGPFDVIVDDGSHHIEHQLFVVREYGPLLAPGGVLVIEDIQDLDASGKLFRELGCEVRDLRGLKGRYDDALVILRAP